MRSYNEDLNKGIIEEIEALRTCARQIHKIKKVVKEFDGKIYNCKFDKAISELSDEECRFWVSNSYGWFYVQASPKNAEGQNIGRSYKNLLSGYSALANDRKQCQTDETNKLFTGKKRIMADKIIDHLNERYASLLQEAKRLEESLDSLDISLANIETPCPTAPPA